MHRRPMPSTTVSAPTAADGVRTSRRRFLVALGAAASGLAGCLESREPSDPEAVEAVEASLRALEDVDGYTSEVGGGFEAAVDGDRITASVDGEHRVDERSRTAHVRVEADDDREEVYVDDATVYEQCDFSHYVNVEDAWYPSETDVDWDDATLLGGQEFLLDISEVYDRGTEQRSGREARVVEFAPDPDEYHEYQRRTTVADADVSSPNSVTVTQWLVDDRPIRIRSEVERSSSGGTIEEDVHYDVTYGAVSIELPPIVDDEDACPRP